MGNINNSKNNKLIICNSIEINSIDKNNLTFKEALPTIKKQLKCICSIINKDKIIITGFLCKIYCPELSNFLPVLITSNKVSEDNNKELKIKLINDGLIKIINIDK